jgi:hypothetical protein
VYEEKKYYLVFFVPVTMVLALENIVENITRENDIETREIYTAI